MLPIAQTCCLLRSSSFVERRGNYGRLGVVAGHHGRVYAIIDSPKAQIYRSDDSGDTWKPMPLSIMVGARPLYYQHLFLDPSNDARVINVGGVLSMSSNAAQTFEPIANKHRL